MRKIIFPYLILSLLFSEIALPQVGWQSVVSPWSVPYASAFFVNTNTGFIAGGYGSSPYPFLVIIKTTNGGTTWTNSKQLNSAGLQDIFFTSAQTGYAVGGYYPNSVILKTTNSGTNWFSQNPGTDKCLFSVFFINEYVGFCCADFGTIIKTTNSGNNWYQVNSATTQYLESIYFTNPLVGYAVGRVGQIMKTTDAGENWSYSLTYSNWLNSVTFTGQDTGYAAGVGGLLLKTINAGQNWNTINTGFTDEFTSVKFVDNSIGYITTGLGKVLYTTDAGQTWTAQTTGTTQKLLSVFFTNTYKGIVCGNNGIILKTQTGGMPLYIPTLLSPANGSFNNSLTPTLTWTAGTNIQDYTVQISPLSNFSIVIDSAVVINNYYDVPPGKLNPATTYFWRVKAVSQAGTGPYSDPWSFATIITNISQTGTTIPEKFELSQNYPNPFNPVTKIQFKVSNSSTVTIKIFDILGKEVQILVNQNLQSGTYEINFNASSLASGIYFYKMTAGSFTETKRMTLIK
jgi:photosystem II stability/assembly factor-like uncharacterized protein